MIMPRMSDVALWLIAACQVAWILLRLPRTRSVPVADTSGRITRYPAVVIPVRCSLPVPYAGQTDVCDRWRNHPARCICAREMAEAVERISIPVENIVIRDEDWEQTSG